MPEPREESRLWVPKVQELRKEAVDAVIRHLGKAAVKVMLTLHKEWIDKLHGARSEIIHERMRLGDGGRTITFPEGKSVLSTLSFEMPPSVVKRLAFLPTFADPKGRVQLVVGAEQIALRAIDAAKAVMTALLEDLGGRVVAAKSVTEGSNDR